MPSVVAKVWGAQPQPRPLLKCAQLLFDRQTNCVPRVGALVQAGGPTWLLERISLLPRDRRRGLHGGGGDEDDGRRHEEQHRVGRGRWGKHS